MEVKKILWDETEDSHLGVYRLVEENGTLVAGQVYGMEHTQTLRHAYEMRRCLEEIAEADSLGEAWTKARLMLARLDKGDKWK